RLDRAVRRGAPRDRRQRAPRARAARASRQGLRRRSRARGDRLMLSKPRALVRVPDVCGLSLRKARILVEHAGLAVDEVLFRESYEQKDTVLAQAPARGQSVYAGEKVTLHVSRESYAKHLPSIFQRSDATGRNFIRELLWVVQHPQ